MMKPSNFILNSDYLSIAQTSTNEYTVYVGGGTLQINQYTRQNFDFNTTSQKGTIDRILIKKDGQNYLVGSYMDIYPSWSGDNNVAGYLHVFRTSATNIRAELVLDNMSAGAATYPSMTFKIKVSSFRPPNVF